MQNLITDAIAWGGYWGIFFLMALENIIPPIPSEVIMGLGGVLVARGEMSFWPLLAAGTIGSTAGNYVWYWAGNKYGYERLHPFVERWGRWLTVDWEDVEKATRFFRRHGDWVVFFLRFSPLLRTIISLPAGLSHMPVWRFLFFTFLGSAIWNAVLVMGGSLLATWVVEFEHVLGYVVFGLIGVAIVGYLYRVFTWKPRAERD